MSVLVSQNDETNKIEFSQEALWDFDETLSAIIEEAMEFFKDHPKYSFNDIEDEEREALVRDEWVQQCAEVVQGFRSYREDQEKYYDVDRTSVLKRPFELLQQMFSGLWT